MRDISYLMSYGKHYFDIDEVGAQVFTGSIGFRSDIKQYSYKHKAFGTVHYNDKEWNEYYRTLLIKQIIWWNVIIYNLEKYV